MTVLLFEDDQVEWLYPISLARPVYQVTCGGNRLWDLVQSWQVPLCVHVRPHLRGVLDASAHQWDPAHDRAPSALVNGRIVPSFDVVQKLRAAVQSGRPGIVRVMDRRRTNNGGNELGNPGASTYGTVALAVLPKGLEIPPGALATDEQRNWGVMAWLDRLNLPSLPLEVSLMDYPHDVVRYHLATFKDNLNRRIEHGDYKEIAEGVFAAPSAVLGPYVITDTSSGPIVLDENASVGPHSFLRGPVQMNAASRVIEHSSIKDFVVLGHTTKVGGEVEGSIIEPYTNKQHHGFLGHSYLGSWVNLGAGTCNSDLKNTYGQVNMEYHGQKVATGMQFIGCIVGDYAKTAINTGIFTGKTVGVCSMVYGFVTTNVPSFVNYARLFGQVTEAPVDVMAATQARMFSRRNVTQRPCDIRLLYDMYQLTRHERQLAGEPLSL